MWNGAVYYKGQISLSSSKLFINKIGQYCSNQCDPFLPVPLILNDFSSVCPCFLCKAVSRVSQQRLYRGGLSAINTALNCVPQPGPFSHTCRCVARENKFSFLRTFSKLTSHDLFILNPCFTTIFPSSQLLSYPLLTCCVIYFKSEENPFSCVKLEFN